MDTKLLPVYDFCYDIYLSGGAVTRRIIAERCDIKYLYFCIISARELAVQFNCFVLRTNVIISWFGVMFIQLRRRLAVPARLANIQGILCRAKLRADVQFLQSPSEIASD